MTERLKIIGSVLRSPVSAYNELKHRRYTDRWLVLVILGLWFLVRILKRQFYGFRFQTQDPNDFSLFIQLATTVLPFLLFMIANWAVCALMDGEGRFGGNHHFYVHCVGALYSVSADCHWTVKCYGII